MSRVEGWDQLKYLLPEVQTAELRLRGRCASRSALATQSPTMAERGPKRIPSQLIAVARRSGCTRKSGISRRAVQLEQAWRRRGVRHSRNEHAGRDDDNASVREARRHRARASD
jgi:hypothetical protein